jgi:DNA-binding transcriptional LysR family regulator
MRKVEGLEDELGVVLAQRAGGRVVLTRVGKAYADALEGALEELARAERVALGAVSGPLRLWLPMMGTNAFITPAFAAFRAEHPDVTLHIELGQNIRRLELGKFDVALQLGTRVNPSLRFKRLYDERLILVASAGYVGARGAPESVDALDGHLAIHERGPEGALVPWRYPDGRRAPMPPPGVSINAIGAAFDLARAGAGIARAPWMLAKDALESGELVQVLPEVHTVETVGFVYMPDPTPTTRAFIEGMERWFGAA